MAFESQNKLISSFNTDNVKQGLFRYQGNTSVSKIRGTGSGFVNLTTAPNTNAGAIYNQVGELIENVAKGVTRIKQVQNEEDELKQSIDAGRVFSEAYQNMQILKEEAVDSVEKQKILDSFRESTYEWSDNLTPNNKKSIDSALHNFLNFEAREQARLVKKENIVDLTNSINNSSLVLLSQEPKDRIEFFNNLRATYNDLGVSNDEFNEIAFSSLSNNLFAGLNSNNVSREALYAIENTVNGLLNDFGELDGSKAYNDTLNKINNLKTALTNRDKSYISRSIQLNDSENFNLYNNVLYENGEITDVEYEQNILAFNRNTNRLARTPQNMYENIRATLGDGIDEFSLDSLKGGLTREDYDAIETYRKGRTIELLSQEVVDTKTLNEWYKLDPKLVENSFKEFTTKSLIDVNSSIGALQDIKDLNSEEAQQHFYNIALITDRYKKLTDDSSFVSLSATADNSNKDIINMLDIHSTVNNPNLSFADRNALLYKKINSFDTTTTIDAKVFNKVNTTIIDEMTKDFGKAYTDKMSGQVRQYIEANIGKGIEPSDVIKSAKEIYKAKKFRSNFIVDDKVSKEIGAIAKEDKDLIPAFFESNRYDELLYTNLENDLRPLLDNGSLSIDEYTVKQQELVGRLQLDLASFKEDYKKMRSSGNKLTMYYDDDLKSFAVTDNKGEPLRVPVPDYRLFDDIFHNYVDNKSNEDIMNINSPF